MGASKSPLEGLADLLSYITPDIAVFVVVLAFALFLYLHFSFDSPWSRRMVRQAPNIILTLGIFFTFLGISIGLHEFQYDQISASIGLLLNGMRVAFWSSVVGLLLSIVFRIVLVFKPIASDSVTDS